MVNMRQIKYIVLHCTAGSPNQTVQSVKNWWKNHLKWSQVGYHHLITADGKDNHLLDISKPSNGVSGYNSNSIHISYTGGVAMANITDEGGKVINAKGSPIDNRTDAQKKTMQALVEKYGAMFSSAVILGHRDFSPDKNRNGVIESHEWIKSCPSFSVKEWLSQIGYKSKMEVVVLVTTTRVNIRSGEGTNFSTVASSLLPNTKVKVLGIGDSWTYVEVLNSNIKGWVASQYLK